MKKIVFIFLLLLSCEEHIHSKHEKEGNNLSFQPKYSLSYHEKSSVFKNNDLAEASGDIHGKAIAVPELESYYEADVSLDYDEELNYHIDIEYTKGSPSELLPEEMIENDIYSHDNELSVYRKTETNGIVNYYNHSGAIIESFDNSAEYLDWKENAVKLNMAYINASIYTKAESLKASQSQRISTLVQKGAQSKTLSNDRIRLSHKMNNSQQNEIIDLKTGRRLSIYSYNENRLSGRSFFRYTKVKGMDLISNEIHQSMTMKANKNDILYENHIVRNNFKVNETGVNK